MNISYYQIQGTRNEQEDYFIVQSVRGYIAAHILDGHSGNECAELAATCLEQDIIPKFDIKEENLEIVKGLQMITGRFKNSGSTLSSIYIKDGELFVSILGDSPVFVINKDKINKIPLHNKHNQSELESCIKRGGIFRNPYIFNEKTNSGLSCYRHLGRTDMGDVTSKEPEFHSFGKEWTSVVLSSDGLVLQEKEIQDLSNFGARAIIQKNNEFLFNKEQDNTTVITISK